jgi:hypothetical protein
MNLGVKACLFSSGVIEKLLRIRWKIRIVLCGMLIADGESYKITQLIIFRFNNPKPISPVWTVVLMQRNRQNKAMEWLWEKLAHNPSIGRRSVPVFIAVALVVFLWCLTGLISAYRTANQSNSWPQVEATVTDFQAIKIENNHYGWEQDSYTEFGGYLTTIGYYFDGVHYQAELREYLSGKKVTVYVNPEKPGDVLTTPGATLQSVFFPVALTAFSGLALIVLCLILISPKHD